MKKLILVMSLIFVTSIGVFAQASQSTDSIIFAKTMHDYGTIDQGADGSCEFVFTNKGKQPLLLTNVSASCGCTVPEWPREPIAAGKTGVIKVKYDTNRVGAFNKSITVSSNAVNSSIVLYIKGTINAKQ
ncbi:MAG: DUF1573 domain-containing protein [Bacteroidales bacterium]|nr:DUF1573 domain-containing protein [Bacteroidales bacterium]